MYSVVASDGKVYGPVDMPTIRQWCQEGRIAPDTLLIDPISSRQMRAAEIQDLYGLFGPTQQPHSQQRPTQGTPTISQQPGPQPFGQQGGQWQQPPGAGMPNSAWSQPPQPMAFHPQMYGSKSKVAAALLAFFLGALGIHRFYLGHNGTGAAMLVLCLLGIVTCGITSMIAGVWAIVDFVLILTDGLVDVSGARLT